MKSEDTPMTSPFAMTAKTPIASNTSIHTPVERRFILSVQPFAVKEELTNQFSVHKRLSPISLVFLGTSLRSRVTILMASKRISMTLLMRASRGARGNAATNMVVKLNWITKDRAKKNIVCQKQSISHVIVVKAFSRVHTHLQKLIEQAEGVNVIETVVAEPVSKLAVVTQFSSVFGL